MCYYILLAKEISTLRWFTEASAKNIKQTATQYTWKKVLVKSYDVNTSFLWQIQLQQ